jgi:hypothetical protein
LLDFKQDITSAEDPVVLRWTLKQDIISGYELAVLGCIVKQYITCG